MIPIKKKAMSTLLASAALNFLASCSDHSHNILAETTSEEATPTDPSALFLNEPITPDKQSLDQSQFVSDEEVFGAFAFLGIAEDELEDLGRVIDSFDNYEKALEFSNQYLEYIEELKNWIPKAAHTSPSDWLSQWLFLDCASTAMAKYNSSIPSEANKNLDNMAEFHIKATLAVAPGELAPKTKNKLLNRAEIYAYHIILMNIHMLEFPKKPALATQKVEACWDVQKRTILSNAKIAEWYEFPAK